MITRFSKAQIVLAAPTSLIVLLLVVQLMINRSQEEALAEFRLKLVGRTPAGFHAENIDDMRSWWNERHPEDPWPDHRCLAAFKKKFPDHQLGETCP